MADRFDAFTERARRVLTLAQEEALRFNPDHIGPEHLLLGVIRQGEGVGPHALTQLGIDLRKARAAIEDISGRGARPASGGLRLTLGARQIIDSCFEEGGALGKSYVPPEHILLARTQ